MTVTSFLLGGRDGPRGAKQPKQMSYLKQIPSPYSRMPSTDVKEKKVFYYMFTMLSTTNVDDVW